MPIHAVSVNSPYGRDYRSFYLDPVEAQADADAYNRTSEGGWHAKVTEVEVQGAETKAKLINDVISIFVAGRMHAPGRMKSLEDSWPALSEALGNLADDQ